MNRFRTPEMNDKVKEFCHSLSPKTKPIFLQVIQTPGAEPHVCALNVKKQIKVHGGNWEYGWIIWYVPNIFYEAEAHTVWVDRNGNKYDITPHPEEDANGEILFLPNNSKIELVKMALSGFPHNVTYPSTESPIIQEYVALLNTAKTKYAAKGHRGFEVYEAVFDICTEEQRYRLLKIEETFSKTVERNELCPCQSGLKYKKCCGI